MALIDQIERSKIYRVLFMNKYVHCTCIDRYNSLIYLIYKDIPDVVCEGFLGQHLLFIPYTFNTTYVIPTKQLHRTILVETVIFRLNFKFILLQFYGIMDGKYLKQV